MKTIELFCGAGGTSCGFQQASFDIRLGLDIDSTVLKTFALNFPAAEVCHKPIEHVTGRELLKQCGCTQIDVLLGGPSCQGYSTIGKRIEDDPRNGLFTHYVRIVSELQPRWILFENVKGMLLYSNGRFIKDLTKKLSDLGYSSCYGVLNAADYGVPQRRERFFLIGTKLNFVPTLPEPTHDDPRCLTCSRPDKSKRVRVKAGCEKASWFEPLACPRCAGTGFEKADKMQLKPWVSVWDAIGDLPIIEDEGGVWEFQKYRQPASSSYQAQMRKGSTGFDLHYAKAVSPLAKEILMQVPEGKGIRSVPPEDLPKRFQIMRKVSNGELRRDCTTLYHRLSRKLPSYTITCSFTNVASGAFVHPLSDRAITPREAARLQSFPDRFAIFPSKVKMQIGNAVPPLLAETLARHILSMEQYYRHKRVSRRDKASNEQFALQADLPIQ